MNILDAINLIGIVCKRNLKVKSSRICRVISKWKGGQKGQRGLVGRGIELEPLSFAYGGPQCMYVFAPNFFPLLPHPCKDM